MGIFRQFPYSNFHEMNMDQLIKLMKTLQEEWETQKTEWADMQEFINNYFDELDLSAEVATKINAMVRDGSFNTIVDPVIATNVTAWLDAHIGETVPPVDDTLTVSGAAADSKVVGDNFKLLREQITEGTRNLAAVQLGRWRSASDGNIYAGDEHYFGMSDYIDVEPNTAYVISNHNLSSETAIQTFIVIINNDDTFSRNGYANNNARSVTTGANAVKMHVCYYSETTLTATDGEIQIEKGTKATPYIQPVSAIDAILRSELNEFPTYHFSSVIGAIIQNAEEYFDQAYNGDPNLVYDSTHGLFALDIHSDNAGEENNPAIVCSQFVWAMMKYITWDNSRYAQDKNHVGQFCFTSDGVNQDTQDGEPYQVSYYQYQNGFDIDTDDVPSYDYMVSAETYRYALNHGWAYEIKENYPQVRPGDIIFSIDEESGFYKHITHCAFCAYTGFDNNRIALLESNTFQFGDLLNIGCGVRNAPLLGNKYGARFPLHELPHDAQLVEHGKTYSVVNTQAYTVGEILTQTHEKGFYTLIIKGSMPSDHTPQIGVLYDGTSSRQYIRILNNGDTHIAFWYAPKSFSSVTFALTAGANINLDSVKLVKGYVPLT